MGEFSTTELNEADTRSWVFEVEGFITDAPHKAKEEVANAVEDVDYGRLNSRLVGQKSIGATYVVVVERQIGRR
jgi:hypothetical protein